MTDAESTRRPEHAAVRTLWLFQALIAGLLSLLWTVDIWRETRQPSYGSHAYHVSKELFLAILAAVIVYAVIVQWQYPSPHPKVTARFELAKGLLATAMWLFLLLDAIFVIPDPWYDYDPYCRHRKIRIVTSANSFAVLCQSCLVTTIHIVTGIYADQLRRRLLLSDHVLERETGPAR